MAGFFRLHNKFHRSSHHSLSSTTVQDQGIDPIASKEEPFNGIFYNNLTDQERSYDILTNSYDWYSTYSTVCSFSANWDSIGTTYSTVCANSANWNSGYSAYNTLCAVSGNYDSVYTTVCANSAFWANEYVLYTNRAQENTRSKTFSGYNLSINPDNTVDWNLDIAQVAYLTLDRNLILNNPLPSSMKNGGLYNLYVIQGGESGGHTLTFKSDYLFPVGVDITTDINLVLSGITIFNFLCDSVFMYGDFYKTTLRKALTGNGIVKFITNEQIGGFVSNNPIYPFTDPTPTITPTFTPTPTPTPTQVGFLLFGTGDSLVEFDGDALFPF